MNDLSISQAVTVLAWKQHFRNCIQNVLKELFDYIKIKLLLLWEKMSLLWSFYCLCVWYLLPIQFSCHYAKMKSSFVSLFLRIQMWMLCRNIWSSLDVPGLFYSSDYKIVLLGDTEKSDYSNSYIGTFCCIMFLKWKASHIHS